MEDLAHAVIAGDPVALARAISLAEEGTPRGERILADVYPSTGRASLIGITGPPGAGKSALARLTGRTTGALVLHNGSVHSGQGLTYTLRHMHLVTICSAEGAIWPL